jgi:hypothetical protein
VGTSLHYLSTFKDDDFITVSDGTQAMGNNQASTPPSPQILVNDFFRFRIQGTGGFIHDENRGVVYQSAGYFQPLSLPST